MREGRGEEGPSFRQQIQRVQGQLKIGPVKTRAGNRDLPLIGLARIALADRQAQQEADRAYVKIIRRLPTFWLTTASRAVGHPSAG